MGFVLILSIVTGMEQATTPRAGKLWIIILAAGESRRLGSPKQLLRMRGRSLLSLALLRAETLGHGRVIVVLGAGARRLRAHIRRGRQPAKIVYNPDWTRGMGSSLAAGIRALPRTADAALILLCDQPLVDIRALARLCTADIRRSAICASRYADRLGVPAIFPRRLFPLLSRLDSDKGARELLNHGSGYRIVAVDMPEAAFDIDTPADLIHLH